MFGKVLNFLINGVSYLPRLWISHGKVTVSPVTTLKVLPLDTNRGIGGLLNIVPETGKIDVQIEETVRSKLIGLHDHFGNQYKRAFSMLLERSQVRIDLYKHIVHHRPHWLLSDNSCVQ
ncbi:hypothetical protein ABEB36_004218 [Hypothenemus hampei]|uniref:Uncharacterized protein n=1 Tax=Hypothenemus hampei TaxID=57062 RepID=A0ABD1F2P0_HYPHA